MCNESDRSYNYYKKIMNFANLEVVNLYQLIYTPKLLLANGDILQTAKNRRKNLKFLKYLKTIFELKKE